MNIFDKKFIPFITKKRVIWNKKELPFDIFMRSIQFLSDIDIFELFEYESFNDFQLYYMISFMFSNNLSLNKTMDLAIEEGYVSSCKIIIKMGLNINYQNTGCLTYLSMAIIHDDLKLVAFLLENNANININSTTKYGSIPPIFFTKYNKDNSILKLLVDYGAEASSIDENIILYDYTSRLLK